VSRGGESDPGALGPRHRTFGDGLGRGGFDEEGANGDQGTVGPGPGCCRFSGPAPEAGGLTEGLKEESSHDGGQNTLGDDARSSGGNAGLQVMITSTTNGPVQSRWVDVC